MKCPKCQFEQADDGTECSRCGIIFSKWKNIPNNTPFESDQKKSSIGFLAITLVFLGILAAVGIAYFSSSNAPPTNKADTPAAEAAMPPARPEDNPFEEIQRKPPTAFQKKMHEEVNKTLDEQCKRGIVEMGGTEEDIKAHCS